MPAYRPLCSPPALLVPPQSPVRPSRLQAASPGSTSVTPASGCVGNASRSPGSGLSRGASPSGGLQLQLGEPLSACYPASLLPHQSVLFIHYSCPLLCCQTTRRPASLRPCRSGSQCGPAGRAAAAVPIRGGKLWRVPEFCAEHMPWNRSGCSRLCCCGRRRRCRERRGEQWQCCEQPAAAACSIWIWIHAAG